MSKLEELIKEFCPNGVKYKRINEFTKLLRGKRLTKSQLVENGKYAVYHGSLVPLGYYNEANRDSGVIIVNTGGIGGVGYSDTPFWCSDGCFCLAHSPKMVDKYVYYALVGFKDYLISRTRVGGVPTIDSDTVLSIKIPLPALPVQREIVRILDSFTLYSAELTAELTARRKQYEFYRDKLLNFSEVSVKKYKLKEIADIYLGLTYTPRYVEHGVTFISSKNIANDYLDLRDVKYISYEEYTKATSNAKPKKGDILFTRVGSNLGHPTIVNIEKELCIFVSVGYLRVNPQIAINKYIKHWMNTDSFWNQVNSKVGNAPKANLNSSWMREFNICLPPMDVQERIVKVLDNFDAICSDLGIGLPAEIEKRQKQYEYYREKLLTFNGKYATILTERNGTERNGTERNGTERAGLIRLLQYVYGFAFVRLGDIATIERGGNFQKKDFVNEGYPCIHYGQIYTKYGISADKTITFVSNEVAKKSKTAKSNDIIMAVTSENVEDVCKCVVWLGNENIAVSGHTAIIHSTQNAKYLAYYFCTSMFFEQKKRYIHGTKVIEVTPSDLANIVIPLPTIEKQKEIVEILDKFDSLCNDLSAGLPAEIEHRQKQYEYYRDKLLRFK